MISTIFFHLKNLWTLCLQLNYGMNEWIKGIIKWSENEKPGYKK